MHTFAISEHGKCANYRAPGTRWSENSTQFRNCVPPPAHHLGTQFRNCVPPPRTTTMDRNTTHGSSGTAKGAHSGHPVPRLRRCARKYAGQEQQLPRRMGASFPGTSQEECRERSQRQPKPGSLVGTKKLLLFNKRKEETAHFQSVVSNLEFGDLAGWAVPTTQDRNTRDPGLPVRRLGRWARSSTGKKCPKSIFCPIGFFSSSLRSELLD